MFYASGWTWNRVQMRRHISKILMVIKITYMIWCHIVLHLFLFCHYFIIIHIILYYIIQYDIVLYHMYDIILYPIILYDVIRYDVIHRDRYNVIRYDFLQTRKKEEASNILNFWDFESLNFDYTTQRVQSTDFNG